MDLDEYQRQAVEFEIGAKLTSPSVVHLLGLAGEVGEFLEVLKKHLRDGTELDTNNLMKECGDCLWYLAVILSDNGKLLSGARHRCWFYWKEPTLTELLIELPILSGRLLDASRGSTYMGVEEGAGHFLDALIRLLKLLNISLDDVLTMNIAKLTDRRERNMLSGKGDLR